MVHSGSVHDRDMTRNIARDSCVSLVTIWAAGRIYCGSRDHNFQLPVYATVLVASLLLYVVFVDLNSFSSM